MAVGTGWNALAAGLQGVGDTFLNMYKMKEAERQQKAADEEAATRLGLLQDASALQRRQFEETQNENKAMQAYREEQQRMALGADIRERARMSPNQLMSPEEVKDFARTRQTGLLNFRPETEELVPRSVSGLDRESMANEGIIPGVQFQMSPEGYYVRPDLMTPGERMAGENLGLSREELAERQRQFDQTHGLNLDQLAIDRALKGAQAANLGANTRQTKWEIEQLGPARVSLTRAQSRWYDPEISPRYPPPKGGGILDQIAAEQGQGAIASPAHGPTAAVPTDRLPPNAGYAGSATPPTGFRARNPGESLMDYKAAYQLWLARQ
jgi:hypothetical protein